MIGTVRRTSFMALKRTMDTRRREPVGTFLTQVNNIVSVRQDMFFQLLDQCYDVIETLENRYKADALYTDFAKAPDKYEHGIIAPKKCVKQE